VTCTALNSVHTYVQRLEILHKSSFHNQLKILVAVRSSVLRTKFRLLVGGLMGEDTDFTEARSNSVETTARCRSRYGLKTGYDLFGAYMAYFKIVTHNDRCT
jgi:hypothetical protein